MTINDELLRQLGENLEALTGYDFEEIERLEHMAGNVTPEAGMMSKSFQARLAARALNVPYPEIQILNLRDYTKVTTAVFNFLYSGSVKEKEPPKLIEN